MGFLAKAIAGAIEPELTREVESTFECWLSSEKFRGQVRGAVKRALGNPPKDKVRDCRCGARPSVVKFDAGPEGMGPEARFGWIVRCGTCGADTAAEATIAEACNEWNAALAVNAGAKEITMREGAIMRRSKMQALRSVLDGGE